jgi:hypothetical protein
MIMDPDEASEYDRLRAENERLSLGLIAIAEAPKTIGSSVLRSIAYDVALNCIDAETAKYQIARRGGLEQKVPKSEFELPPLGPELDDATIASGRRLGSVDELQ